MTPEPTSASPDAQPAGDPGRHPVGDLRGKRLEALGRRQRLEPVDGRGGVDVADGGLLAGEGVDGVAVRGRRREPVVASAGEGVTDRRLVTEEQDRARHGHGARLLLRAEQQELRAVGVGRPDGDARLGRRGLPRRWAAVMTQWRPRGPRGLNRARIA
jgi:hypothetical protein